MTPEQREEIAALLGARIVHERAIGGGDVNEANLVSLADGREVFIKTNPGAPADLFAAEARGLSWLAEAGALRVPAVVAVDARALALEWVPPGTPADDFDERLGRGLAALHRSAPAGSGFGLDHDNFIGVLPQPNAPAPTWSEFFRSRRLEPQLRRATDAGLVPPRIRRLFTRLLARLEDRLGPEEQASRLHGDLWNGNVLCDRAGRPCLIDPAVYRGHREMDLAMMRLFGGFSEWAFAAYEESWSTAPGAADRGPIYQLYPLLVHLNLFGGAYLSNLESALTRGA